MQLIYKIFTFQEASKLVKVVCGDLMEVSTGPHRADEDGDEHTNQTSNHNCGQSLVGHLEELVVPITGDGDEAKCQDEDHCTVVIPRLNPGEEPGESCCGSCEKIEE